MEEQSAPQKKKGGTYDLVDLILFIGIALMFDVGSLLIPGIGSLGMVLFRLIFYLKRVNTKLINFLMFLGVFLELIPVIEVIPSPTLYVIVVFFMVKAEERLQKRLAKSAPELGRTLNTAADAEGGTSSPEASGAAAPTQGAGKPRSAQTAAGGSRPQQESAGAEGSPLVEGQPQATMEDQNKPKPGTKTTSRGASAGENETQSLASPQLNSAPVVSGDDQGGGRFAPGSPRVTESPSAQLKDVPKRNQVDLKKPTSQKQNKKEAESQSV